MHLLKGTIEEEAKAKKINITVSSLQIPLISSFNPSGLMDI